MTVEQFALTVRQAAEAVNMGEPFIRHAVNSGALKAKRLKSKGDSLGRIRIDVSDLKAWFDSFEDVAS